MISISFIHLNNIDQGHDYGQRLKGFRLLLRRPNVRNFKTGIFRRIRNTFPGILHIELLTSFRCDD